MSADDDEALRQRLAATFSPRAQAKQKVDVDVAADLVRRAVDEAIARVVADIPKPQDGRDGLDAKALDPAELATLIADAAARIVAALPAPRPVKDGKDGKDGVDGKDAPPAKRAPWAFDVVLRDAEGQIARIVATPLP